MTELDDAAYQAEGEALVAEILAYAAPLVDGRPTKVIVQIMAGVMVATILLAAKDDDARRRMLRLTAATLIKIADRPVIEKE